MGSFKSWAVNYSHCSTWQYFIMPSNHTLQNEKRSKPLFFPMTSMTSHRLRPYADPLLKRISQMAFWVRGCLVETQSFQESIASINDHINTTPILQPHQPPSSSALWTVLECPQDAFHGTRDGARIEGGSWWVWFVPAIYKWYKCTQPILDHYYVRCCYANKGDIVGWATNIELGHLQNTFLQ